MNKLFSKFAKNFRHAPPFKNKEEMHTLYDWWCREVVVKDNWHPQKLMSTVTLAHHRVAGAQMWITKQVSSDLMKSDIPDPDFSQVKWPMQSLEFVFEDPSIPTFLLRNSEPTSLYDFSESLGDPAGKELPHRKVISEILKGWKDKLWLSVFLNERDNAMLSISTSAEEMAHFAKADASYKTSDPELTQEGDDGFVRDTEYDDELKPLVLLAYKVLMFAGIPKFSPRVVRSGFQKKDNGKPGFMNRPNLVRHIVEYLPHHIVEKKSEASKLGESHSFRGRRGHFRTYSAERFVNKKGDRDYMWPVPNPHGEDVKRKFIVRKP